MPSRTFLQFSGLSGLSGVALGAFGAHALGAQLTASGQLENWKTAVSYQLIHTLAILAVALWSAGAAPSKTNRLFTMAASSWAIGIVLFSGSLYTFALGGPRWLWPVTPIGGLAFLIGWGCILAGGLKQTNLPDTNS